MKKLIVAIVLVGTFAWYCLWHAQSNAASATSGGSPDAGTAPTTTSGGGTTVPTATTIPGAKFRDGTYNGSVADAQWGSIQVQAIIKQGKLADVKYLQYPNERSRSIYINSYADPQLTSEAIQAQSASVDYITGATDTSYAFMQSLSDALTQAQA